MNIERITHAYIVCALWASTDDEGNPMDDRYEPSDVALGSLQSAMSDITDFVEANRELLGDMDDERIGHDFWLTRNHHGAGFWDRGLGERGNQLTAAAHVYGSSDCYVGDNGKVYLS
jgi:hypothetical protein